MATVEVELPNGTKIQAEAPGGHDLHSIPEFTTEQPVGEAHMSVGRSLPLGAMINLTCDMKPHPSPSVHGELQILRKDGNGNFRHFGFLKMDHVSPAPLVRFHKFRSKIVLDLAGEYVFRMYVFMDDKRHTVSAYWGVLKITDPNAASHSEEVKKHPPYNSASETFI
ncbi:hypothetical protein FQN50_006611 [Emmonsiellopsis sp. PD_5]|nr:hypothetical protein FQN50_006611 [Emmonsiellopsis sp. PD_5]